MGHPGNGSCRLVGREVIVREIRRAENGARVGAAGHYSDF